MIQIQPLDIVVFDGLAKFLHSIIEWRSLDAAVHCAVAADTLGSLYDPDFKGISRSHLMDYTGRQVSVYRYNQPIDQAKLLTWLDETAKASTGYDYLQWFFGFVCGIRAKKLADDPTKWTCAELPYWMFQENGYKLTPKDELLPMPRLFRYSPHFTTIFEGEL